ncbi:uncharacterized protein LOC120425612 [Culex pipiens pallens]|uniref:uncharacterized protein LOC120425612 n=1 Tax=Culex pipiens pallens TaxID=42434 RepID=UPI001954CF42|nr:uncharacterized protein LOC120425612 [Culex pipiens pallens]
MAPMAWHVTAVVTMAMVAAATVTKASPQFHTPLSVNTRQIINSLVRDLRETEKSLTPLKTSKTSLERNFTQYRTKKDQHHGRQAVFNLHRNGQNLLQKALQLQTNASQLENRIERQFEPRLRQLQALPRNSQDSTVDNQIAQSVNIYRRICELLLNLIEVPAYIIAQLSGADSDEFGDSEQDEGLGVGGDVAGDYGDVGVNGTE